MFRKGLLAGLLPKPKPSQKSNPPEAQKKKYMLPEPQTASFSMKSDVDATVRLENDSIIVIQMIAPENSTIFSSLPDHKGMFSGVLVSHFGTEALNFIVEVIEEPSPQEQQTEKQPESPPQKHMRSKSTPKKRSYRTKWPMKTFFRLRRRWAQTKPSTECQECSWEEGKESELMPNKTLREIIC